MNLSAIIGGVMSGIVFLSLTIVLSYFLKCRRMRNSVAPYPKSMTLEGAALAVGNFAEHPIPLLESHGKSSTLQDQPVEVGLMSRSRLYASFSSDISRCTLTSS